jgi:N-acetyl-anhydromuramyl-L-alanine amidase AmpD
MRRIDKIIIHCSATPPTMDIGAKEIRSWHVNERKWRDIGYHFVVRRSGEVEIGRPIEMQGAHASGHNSTSVGVCWAGGVDKDMNPENNMTKEQEAELWCTVQNLMLIYGIKKDQVVGHRDLPGVSKACPSFDVKEWIDGKD